MACEHLSRVSVGGSVDEVLACAQASSEQAERDAAQRALVRGLLAHQRELELQNRELRDALRDALRSRDRYAERYDQAPIAYLTLDAQHAVRACNLRAAELLRKPRQEVLGVPLLRLVDAADPSLLRALLLQAERQARGVSAELAVHFGDELCSWEIIVDACGDPATGASELRCAFSDVTARARAERERDRAFASERALHRRFEALDRINIAAAGVLGIVDCWDEEAALEEVVADALSYLGAESARVELRGSARSEQAARGMRPPEASPLTLSVPLQLGTKDLGRLVIGVAHVRGGIEDLQRTLELVAERVALALESARLNRAEAEERAQLALLDQISGELAFCHDLGSTFAALRRALARVVPRFATACVLCVRDDAEALRVQEVVHAGPHAAAALARCARVVAGPLEQWVTRTGAALTQPLAALGVPARVARRLGFSWITAVPLRAREQRLGILVFGYAADRAGLGHLSELLEQLSERCALALDAARLLEDLRAAVASRDTLLAVVSHDLRSPLNAIALTASMLGGSGRARGGKSAEAQVQLIKSSVARMASLVEDLLSAANLEAGQFSVQPTAQRPTELVREACMLSAPSLESTRLTLEQSLPADLPDVAADRPRILQVLGNLLGNAIKFTPSGGVLRVGVEHVEERLRFFVADTGPGIAPHLHARIFARYWAGVSSQRYGQGLGLGLYIAERIVTAHHGRIWVESAPGHGAQFFFELPRAVKPLTLVREPARLAAAARAAVTKRATR